MTLTFRLFFVLERIFGRPFPSRICFLDVRRFLHGRRRDDIIGMTSLVGHPRSGLDDEPFARKIAGIARSPPRLTHWLGKRLPEQIMSSARFLTVVSAAATSCLSAADWAMSGSRSL